jgi:hypothetical protein
LREDADKLVVTLEKLEKIACDRESITRDVTREVNERLENSRNDIRDIATKLKEEAHAVELKQKQIFKDGYEKGQADIYKKLGIKAPQLIEVEE